MRLVPWVVTVLFDVVADAAVVHELRAEVRHLGWRRRWWWWWGRRVHFRARFVLVFFTVSPHASPPPSGFPSFHKAAEQNTTSSTGHLARNREVGPG